MGLLDGKVVAVTGASAGTGRGIADRFAAEGASVCLLARDAERLETVASESPGHAVAVPTDIGDPAAVTAAFDRIGSEFGHLDILVNNAAVYRPCRIEELSDFDVERTTRTNLLGPIYTSRAAIPLLRAAGGGDIVNTSSESTMHPFPMLSIYVATKAALEAFGDVLAQEVRDDDIRVTTVVQGTAVGAGGGSIEWELQPDRITEALQMWTERGLLAASVGRLGGQEIDAVADVHLYIVTRPRTQKLDRVHCRSF